MGPADARMCWERHATSKITQVDDLQAIRTKGFRGEALASIAAIAQVELRTRPADDELGTRVVIEGSRVKLQETVACSAGSSLSVRNLFFNVPARRQFLKSDSVELKHVIDEFQRVALAHPEIAFDLLHNEHEIHRMPAGQERQRIVHVFGRKYEERLVPVEEETDFVSVQGFVGKPEFAKRTRGEQFFFVNRRFIRSSYLEHAVRKAYNELLSRDNYPSWFLFLEIDPAQIIDRIGAITPEAREQRGQLVGRIAQGHQHIGAEGGIVGVLLGIGGQQALQVRGVPGTPLG
jgi:DNA mismatch repair protein MutL